MCNYKQIHKNKTTEQKKFQNILISNIVIDGEKQRIEPERKCSRWHFVDTIHRWWNNQRFHQISQIFKNHYIKN